MSEEFLTVVGALIAAVIGGSGIVGLVAGGAELSRRSRLRRRVEKSIAVCQLLAPGTSARTALEHAIDADVARLAALSVVGLGGFLDRWRGMLGAFAVMAVSITYAVVARDLEGLGRGEVGVPVVVMGVLYLLALGYGWAALLLRGPGPQRRFYVRQVLRGVKSEDAMNGFAPGK